MQHEKNDLADPRIEFFDNLADGWDDEEPSEKNMIEKLERHAEMLKFTPGETLLEVGCGTGKTTGYLSAAVKPGKVMAVDFSPAMISRAKDKDISAYFVCMDVCSTPLPEKTFDVVFCFHCFPHFRDQTAALENFAYALKPDGRLIIMHLAGSEHINSFHANLEGAVGGDMLCDENEWPKLLEKAGFKLKKFIDREDLFFLEARL